MSTTVSIGHTGSTRADVNRGAASRIRAVARHAARAPAHAVAGVTWNRWVRKWQAVFRPAKDPDDTRPPPRLRHVGYYTNRDDAQRALTGYGERVSAAAPTPPAHRERRDADGADGEGGAEPPRVRFCD